MPSSYRGNIGFTIFGESHGPSIGVVLDGLPAGISLDLEEIAAFLRRRAPGRSRHATARREADLPQIQSGLYRGRTTGTPLCAVIANTDTRSKDYEDMEVLCRPGHADYTGAVRYGGAADPRGGGHFSGRLTAPLCFAGAVAMQLLAGQGIRVGAHILSLHGVAEAAFDPVELDSALFGQIAAKDFPVVDDARGAAMQAEIDAARAALDSVGGVIECAATGVPAGLGSPLFDGLENRISSLVFGIPAVRGIEFGAGFAAAEMTGSQHNDPWRMGDGGVRSPQNHHGGILGGISSGMPILFRVAVKPTPSIAQPQDTVDLRQGADAVIRIHGRHDPCILPRAVPCVEAAAALALLDSLLEGGNPNGFNAAAAGN